MSFGALALIVAFVLLGRWQLARADYKRELFAEFAAGADATLNLAGLGTPIPGRYQHIAAHGRYDSEHQVVLDNLSLNERAGFRVLTPFVLEDGTVVLVDRGWFVLGRTRADWPALDVPTAPRGLRGRIDELPVPGIRLDAPSLEATTQTWPKLMNFPTWPDLEAAYGRKLYPKIVLLDRAEPDGFTREWTPPGFAPERHVAYAVQWFGLAATVAALYVVLNLRKQAPA